jgi:hypothetical protein
MFCAKIPSHCAARGEGGGRGLQGDHEGQPVFEDGDSEGWDWAGVDGQ